MKTSNKRANRRWFVVCFVGLVFFGVWNGPTAWAQQPTALQNTRPAQEQPDRPETPPAEPKQKPLFEAFRPQNSYEARLLVAALGLSPDQMARIQNVYRQYGQTMVIAARDMRLKRIELDEALFSDDFSEATVTQRAKEFAEAQNQVVMLQTKIQSQIRQILTTEQVHRFLDLRQDGGPRQLAKPFKKEMAPNRKF
ncbi:MAG: periplasmic heavy metal sensor [Blastocatellia bacterium]|nr:periplasmic heavy metal sensor [Blastocatellia bacterium]